MAIDQFYAIESLMDEKLCPHETNISTVKFETEMGFFLCTLA